MVAVKWVGSEKIIQHWSFWLMILWFHDKKYQQPNKLECLSFFTFYQETCWISYDKLKIKLYSGDSNN